MVLGCAVVRVSGLLTVVVFVTGAGAFFTVEVVLGTFLIVEGVLGLEEDLDEDDDDLEEEDLEEEDLEEDPPLDRTSEDSPINIKKQITK